MAQDVLQFFSIELHPAAADEDEVALRLPQVAPFALGERLAVHRQPHVEIHQRFEAELGGRLVADRDLDRNARALLPPVGNADDDARLLEGGHFEQEPVRLVGRPRARPVDAAVVDQRLDHFTLLRRALHREKKREQRRLVAGEIA